MDTGLLEIENLRRELDIASIKRCMKCRGCEKDCPAFKVLEGYNPIKLYNSIIDVDDLMPWIESEMIWQCLECHTCTEMCPQTYSWEKVFTKFKAYAMKLGAAPKSVKKGVETYMKSGLLGMPNDRARVKLGLPPSPIKGSEEFIKMLNVILENKEEKK